MEGTIIQLEISVLSLFDVFSFSASVILGLLFLTVKSDNRRANVFLSLFLFSLAGEILAVLMEAQINSDKEIFQTTLFTMPLLMFYIKHTINRSYKRLAYLLFIPGIVFNYFSFSSMLFEYVFNIFILLYILLCINNHQHGVRQFFSSLEMNTLKWMRLIAYIFLSFHALWIIEDIIVLNMETLEAYFAGLSSLLTLFMIFWIGHNGLSQGEIFKQRLFIDVADETIKHCESKLPESDRFLWEKLNDIIQSERLFTDPKLTLRRLSVVSEIGEKEVSRVINQQGNCNFYQLINRYRIEEFKKMLTSNKAAQMSFVGLAEEAGFNSKSTFYSAFKAQEGITPKQYHASVLKSG